VKKEILLQILKSLE